jgi:hypothetical protein
MSDNIQLDVGTGGAYIKTDDDGTAHWQEVKIAFGPDGTQTRVTSSVGLPVGDAGGSLTVDDGGLTLSVDDGGGTLTVDGTVAATQSGTWVLQPATLASYISAATTNATSVKASAGTVYSIDLSNANAAVRWFKLYNKASAPTVGTDTPVFRALIPASGGRTISFPNGLTFSTGIAFALVTGAADSNTSAVAANELTVNIGYA